MMIMCESIYGNSKLVPIEKLVFRPAVYAAILQDEKILLLNTHSTGKYSMPGGGVEIHERLEDALRREVREETGLEIEIVRFLDFRESFFYYDPLDEAYHCFSFFYLCNPKTLELIPDDQVNDGEAEKPRWVDMYDLREEDMQGSGGELLPLLRQISQNPR